MTKIITSGGYEADAIELEELKARGDVTINLSYEDAYGILLDGLQAEASIEPLDQSTFVLNAENLLGLLIDASEDLAAEGE